MLIGADVIDQRVGDETISDVALQAVDEPRGRSSYIAKVRLVRRNVLRRKPSYRLVDVDEVVGPVPAVHGHGRRGGPAARPAPGRGRRIRERAADRPAAPLAAAMDDDRLADRWRSCRSRNRCR